MLKGARSSSRRINALRFTPHFNLTSEEIDMIISIVRESLYALHEPAELEVVVQ